jgi:SAM-dependent methyltransferase
MNQSHLEFLASPAWAEQLRLEVLPWVESAGELGDDVLEIGPGPGLTTDLLRGRVERVTAVEIDPSLAEPLRHRLAGTNVEVVCGDAADTGFADDRFSTALAFSVLHHVPTPEHQDRIFAELARVLRPGGMFVGIDSLDLDMIRQGHADDTFVPLRHETFPERLAGFGFGDVTIDTVGYHFRFVARLL